LLVSQVQAIALAYDLSKSLNESNYYFINPLFEPGQVSDHLMDGREEVIVELLFQIRPLDYGVCWQ
jgi:hypothetical protein